MLEETDRVDMVLNQDGRPLMVITDSGITTDPEERKTLLIAKLHSYATALGSEEFQQQFAKYKEGSIKIACAEEPDEGIRGFSKITVRPSDQEPFDIPVHFTVIKPKYSRPE